MPATTRKRSPKAAIPLMEPPKLLLRMFVAGKPISVNAMYTAGRGRNRYAGRRLTDAAQTWKQCVWAETIKHRPSMKLDGRCFRVRLEFYGLRANSDADNYCKTSLDGLANGLGVNDKHFAEVSVRKVAGKDYPQGAFIEVWLDEASEKKGQAA